MSHCWLKKDEISTKKGLLQRSQGMVSGSKAPLGSLTKVITGIIATKAQ